jgi:hypothetical protein
MCVRKGHRGGEKPLSYRRRFDLRAERSDGYAVVRLNERTAKLAFKLVPFVILLIAGAILLLFASMSLMIDGERVFEPYLGTAGIVALIVGFIGILMIALTK